MTANVTVTTKTAAKEQKDLKDGIKDTKEPFKERKDAKDRKEAIKDTKEPFKERKDSKDRKEVIKDVKEPFKERKDLKDFREFGVGPQGSAAAARRGLWLFGVGWIRRCFWLRSRRACELWKKLSDSAPMRNRSFPPISAPI